MNTKELSKTYQVNYLLGMSRLPDHFYGLIHNLKGRDELYKNPGVSLRSFIIARCIRQEIVELTGEMLENAELCEEFSRSTDVLASIVDHLLTSSAALCERIGDLDPDVRGDYVMFTLPINEFSQVVKLSFDSFIMNQDPSLDHVDITSQHGINLKSAMIDLQMLLVDVSSHMPIPKTLA